MSYAATPQGAATAALARGHTMGAPTERLVTGWTRAYVEPFNDAKTTALPLMLDTLTRPDTRLRAQAAHAIGEIGGASLEIRTALDTTMRGANATVRQAATAALRRLKYRTCVLLLVDSLGPIDSCANGLNQC